jgi:hypothetical protein
MSDTKEYGPKTLCPKTVEPLSVEKPLENSVKHVFEGSRVSMLNLSLIIVVVFSVGCRLRTAGPATMNSSSVV